MAQPRRVKDARSEIVITFRLTEPERQRLREQARHAGISVSALIRRRSLGEA